MSSSTDKIKVCVEIPADLYKQFNLAIINKHGKVHGKIKKSLVEAIKLWLEEQKQ